MHSLILRPTPVKPCLCLVQQVCQPLCGWTKEITKSATVTGDKNTRQLGPAPFFHIFSIQAGPFVPNRAFLLRLSDLKMEPTITVPQPALQLFQSLVRHFSQEANHVSSPPPKKKTSKSSLFSQLLSTRPIGKFPVNTKDKAGSDKGVEVQRFLRTARPGQWQSGWMASFLQRRRMLPGAEKTLACVPVTLKDRVWGGGDVPNRLAAVGARQQNAPVRSAPINKMHQDIHFDRYQIKKGNVLSLMLPALEIQAIVAQLPFKKKGGRGL